MVDSMQSVSVPRPNFLHNIPDYYLAQLTDRQWRLIVSALSQTDCEESKQLAKDLLKLVLPPCDSRQSGT